MSSLRGTSRHVRVLGLVALLVAGIAAPACGGLSSDCSDFCDRWHECVDSKVDVGTCEDRCEGWADGDSDRETKVEKCAECLAQNDTCSDTSRRCAADCLGIPLK